MTRADFRRHDVGLVPRAERVILRPFIPGEAYRVEAILSRTLALSEACVAAELAAVLRGFASRHLDLETRLLAHYDAVAAKIVNPRSLSRARKVLIGAVFSGEYALEAAALFNPSIVPHPDQSGVEPGALRFVMSLRATGEGHISSIEFRAGSIDAAGAIRLDPASPYVSLPDVDPDPRYDKAGFLEILGEMGCGDAPAAALLDQLGDVFTRSELKLCMLRNKKEARGAGQDCRDTLQRLQWIADSNYGIDFPPALAIDERAIYPVSANESNGIEDARFVRFAEDDGGVLYYATYTAYNGHAILPQLIETRDFRRFRVRTLNGNAVRNKGMALFPRRIGGRYAMLSRQDDENLFIMFSDHVRHWSDSKVIMRPAEPWETSKIGNCGSPLETAAGWLVVTHGVGPMRRYCLGAALLDLDDPTLVIGRLRSPLLEPEGPEREGYVPNVVYSCGALIHGGRLVLPFAASDRSTSIVSVPLDVLIAELEASPPRRR
jgi:predicted GH43/DUF377 family glycosyl hydrolase